VIERDRSCTHALLRSISLKVGSEYQGVYVPADAFGRKFENGVSAVGCRAEDDLHYLMGIWGSAFAATFQTIFQSTFDEMKDSVPRLFRWILDNLVAWGANKRLPFSVAKVHNYAYKMDYHRTASDPMLKLVDAGLSFNLPVPPLTRRRADLIVVCDMSLDAEKDGPAALANAQKYLRARGVPFPRVDPALLDRSVASKTFTADDGPVVVYLPAIGKDDFEEPGFEPSIRMPTKKFSHDATDVEMYRQLIKHIVAKALPSIKEALVGVCSDRAGEFGKRALCQGDRESSQKVARN
jgi:Lysophospholipase catalytic domain